MAKSVTFSAFRQTVKRVFRSSGAQRRPERLNARVLANLTEEGMKMMAIPLTAQGVGAMVLAAALRGTGSSMFLICWAAAAFASIIAAVFRIHFFWADKNRVSRIRWWLRTGVIHSALTGLIWGTGGAVFPGYGAPGALALSLAVVLGVMLLSWPCYAMWMPDLVFFAVFTVFPTAAAVFLHYGSLPPVVLSLLFLLVLALVLYSGKRLHSVILSSILTENENRKLMLSLAREKREAESARRHTAEISVRQQEFYRAANHDLRQPLQALGIYLQILRTKAAPEMSAITEQISSCAKSISDLVEQILEVSRVNADSVAVHREIISVPEYFAEFRNEFSELLQERGGRFSVRAAEDLQLDTDAALLSRVLRNLIGNALKYSDKPHPDIILSAKKRPDGRVQISVHDNGPGISEEDRKKIFRSFYRGEAGRRSGGGYGLGLSIVAGICRRLDIRLSVVSVLGRGTVFRLDFGESASKEPKALLTGSSRKVTSEEKAKSEPLHARVLYLEDSPEVVRSMKLLLESWGAEVQCSPFLNEELTEKMKTFQPDLMISDFNLGTGVPNGLESILKLSYALGRTVPAVLLSAVSEDQIESEWQKLMPKRALAEMPELLRKPVPENVLNSVLVRMLKQKKTGF